MSQAGKNLEREKKKRDLVSSLPSIARTFTTPPPPPTSSALQLEICREAELELLICLKISTPLEGGLHHPPPPPPCVTEKLRDGLFLCAGFWREFCVGVEDRLSASLGG
jgi:hypothetical protein